MITETAGKYPQESYATVVRAIQVECIFLLHATKDTVYAFDGVEKLLQETFLPRLLFGKSKYLLPIVGTLSTMQAKKSGPILQDPEKSANEKYILLLHTKSELIGAITEER